MDDPTIRAYPIFDLTHKTQPVSFSSMKAHYERIFICAVEAFSSVLPNRIKADSMETWYGDRLAWGAAGGAPGAKIQWSSDSTERLNKRGALLMISYSHLERVLNDIGKAHLYSKMARKWELGKFRGIWNTAIENYIFQGYIADIIENNARGDTWYSAGESPRLKYANEAKRVIDHIFSSTVMWDYSDFNINHTFILMKVLLAAALTVLLERVEPNPGEDIEVIRNDMKRCVVWTNTARDVTILDNNNDEEIEIVALVARSMQSGERMTSFINTFSSRTYLLSVNKWAMQTLGRELAPTSDSSVTRRSQYHLGDDVWAYVSDVVDGLLLCIIFNLHGYAGQLYKITLSYSGVGEYLRLMYDSHESTVAGYPIRSLAGLIGGEFSRDSIQDPGARAVSFVDQYQKVINRGAKYLPTRLLHRMIDLHCTATYTPPGDRPHRITVPYHVLSIPSSLGGYGIRTSDWHSISLSKYGTTAYSGIVSVRLCELIHPLFCLNLKFSICVKTRSHVNILTQSHSHIFTSIYDVSSPKVYVTSDRLDNNEQNYIFLGLLDFQTSFQVMTKFFVLLANYISNNSQLPLPNDITMHSLKSNADPPPLSVPRIDPSLFWSKDNVKRFDGATLLPDLRFKPTDPSGAGKHYEEIKQVIAKSVLSGAYDKKSISKEYAVYAMKLEKWLKGIQNGNDVIISNLSTPLLNEFSSYITAHAIDLYQYVNNMNTGQKLQSAKHLISIFNVSGLFNKHFGFSNYEAFQIYVKQYRSLGAGISGKWAALFFDNLIGHDKTLLDVQSRYLHLFYDYRTNEAALNFISMLLVGGIVPYPPPPNGLSPSLISFIRSLINEFISHLYTYVH
ncbi:RNA-dependent RNA polymerase [Picoa juniperi mycovirus 1]|uniref:RNA-directed RNA polymerase n=1 Tax=Picoa juniperi mycovirus 1 TaxID=2778518 RepID=A0A7L8Y9C1_9VIRU|nr:RNA-dependent RNA polymerase [Picoa juniperi mycovirus 1]